MRPRSDSPSAAARSLFMTLLVSHRDRRRWRWAAIAARLGRPAGDPVQRQGSAPAGRRRTAAWRSIRDSLNRGKFDSLLPTARLHHAGLERCGQGRARHHPAAHHPVALRRTDRWSDRWRGDGRTVRQQLRQRLVDHPRRPRCRRGPAPAAHPGVVGQVRRRDQQLERQRDVWLRRIGQRAVLLEHRPQSSRAAAAAGSGTLFSLGTVNVVGSITNAASGTSRRGTRPASRRCRGRLPRASP